MRTVAPVAAAVLVAALAALPQMLTGTYYQFMLVVTFIYIIVTTGLNILAGYTGQFSLGHAGLFAVGAYTSALLSKRLGAWPLLGQTGLEVVVAMVAGVLMACLFGAVLAYPALRVRGPYLAMVTVAFGWVIWKILLEWVSVTGGELGITSIPRAHVGGWVLDTSRFYYVTMTLAVAGLLLQRNLVTSAEGRKLQAVKHSEPAAASLGIDVYRTKVSMFVVSAGFAGVGGALFAHQQSYINPDNFKFFDSVFFLLAVLFGGASTLLGPVVGAATLVFLPELLQEFDHYRLIVYGLIILLTLYLLPRGVCGSFPTGRRTPTPQPAGGAVPTVASAAVPSSGVAGRPLLEVAGVSKSFGGVRALDDVSLEVPARTVHALIGPNGAGKTTLLNIVSGAYRADRGAIRLAGQAQSIVSPERAARLGIARTFQTIKLFAEMTVLDHVLVGFERQRHTGLAHAMAATRVARAEDRALRGEAYGLLEFVGLAGVAHQPATSLAYGHRRLLELARALAVKPQLLLLDEPAAGLVAHEIEALDRLIVELRGRGLTILLVEHHMDLVMSISDSITVLDHGVVIGRGKPAEIQGNERVVEAYLGPAYDAVRH